MPVQPSFAHVGSQGDFFGEMREWLGSIHQKECLVNPNSNQLPGRPVDRLLLESEGEAEYPAVQHQM